MSTRASNVDDTGLGHTPLRDPRYTLREGEPVPSLLRRLVDEFTTLFAKELALFTSETTAAVSDVRAGIARLLTGGAVTFAGLLFLLLAAVFWLAQFVEPWVAALIVGGVVTLIGVIMLTAGRKKVEPGAFRPRHTEAALKKDRDMIKGATGHER